LTAERRRVLRNYEADVGKHNDVAEELNAMKGDVQFFGEIKYFHWMSEER